MGNHSRHYWWWPVSVGALLWLINGVGMLLPLDMHSPLVYRPEAAAFHKRNREAHLAWRIMAVSSCAYAAMAVIADRHIGDPSARVALHFIMATSKFMDSVSLLSSPFARESSQPFVMAFYPVSLAVVTILCLQKAMA